MNVKCKLMWGQSSAMLSWSESGGDIALLGEVGVGQVGVIAFSRVRWSGSGQFYQYTFVLVRYRKKKNFVGVISTGSLRSGWETVLVVLE